MQLTLRASDSQFHFAAAQSGAEMLCESNVVIGMNSAPGQTPIVYVVLPLMTLHRSEQKTNTNVENFY